MQILDMLVVGAAKVIGSIGADQLRKTVGTVLGKTLSVRSTDDARAEIESQFSIGESSGENNECLLNTIVQLLSLNGIWIGEGALSQAGLHRFLVDAEVIADGQMIDVYNPDVTQAIAAAYHVRFQVHQVTPWGSVITHPVIGTEGPILHLLHQGAHFSPLFQKIPHQG